jgi:hypothetical protein
VTTSAATGHEALGWADLALLRRGLSNADGRVRAAAAEAAGRLPLTPAAWEQVGDVLAELLASPSLGVARTAAHAPLARLRQELRTIAVDGGHPGQHVAAVALAEVGDDSVLAAEVSRLIARPLTDRAALRLASLPMERLRVTPSLPQPEPAAQSWWATVAAARIGDITPLDDWLQSMRGASSALPASVQGSLQAVLPLPSALLDHVEQQLSPTSAAHIALRAAWLTPPGVRATPGRLDPLAEPLGQFVVTVQSGSALDAGRQLGSDASALPADTGPDPQAVYDTWLRVARPAAAAWAAVAWTLGRAGPAALVKRLARWLADPDSAVAACEAIRDAAAWLAAADPPHLPAGPPPWPRPGELIEHAETTDDAPADPWTDAELSFDVDAGPTFRGIEPESQANEPPAVPEAGRPQAPAYARMDCPPAVVVKEEFALEVGLGDRPTRGVTAQTLTMPERPEYTLTVQVVVDGFALRTGEHPTVELAVTPATPYPTGTLHLRAHADPQLGALRSILAVFSVDGHAVGSATRAVEVVDVPADLPAQPVAAPATGVDTALPAAAQSTDLMITIAKGDDIEGRRLLWSFQSPHGSVPGAAKPLVSTLGSRPDEFARNLMRSAGRIQGESLKRLIGGKSRRIGEVMPPEVHAALRATAAAAGSAPSVLILSADPYIPWELARLDGPWLPDAPAILGAQAIVGRWALRTPGPTSDPPRSVSVQAMTVVRGIYEGVVGFKRLQHAELEAIDLQQTYGAKLVDASEDSFYACLDGEPSAEVLHFAMHGRFDPTGLQDGLILVDGVVEPDMILDADLARHPFVFLNACQVGSAGETLGQYGGMAQSFVEAGASAVIAPLWVVKDDVARDVSLRFYASAFAGTSPAEFLRVERARDGSGTHLAYVLYGHPLLQLTLSDRSKETDGDGDPAGP